MPGLSNSPQDKIFSALLERCAAPSGKPTALAWTRLAKICIENKNAIIPLNNSGRLTEYEKIQLRIIIREYRLAL